MAASDTDSSPATPVRVWDLPTRVFHWLLAAAVIGAVASAKIGGGAMVWHSRLGYAIGALVVFRIVWGFVGGRWSRFASFVRGPGAVWRYLRGQPGPGERFDVGHNPLGALSVLLMLLWLAIQVGTGLVSDDEIAYIGPLNRFVSTDTGLEATSWHKTFGQWGLIALVVLHLVAIAAYRLLKKVNLVGPMLRGDRPLPGAVPGSRDDTRTRLAAALLLAACTGGMAWLVSLGA
jgi:cytochrome b